MSSTANELSSSFSGEQIASLLRTNGPIVSCVLLQAADTASSLSPASMKRDKDSAQNGERSGQSTTNSDNYGDKAPAASKHSTTKMSEIQHTVISEDDTLTTTKRQCQQNESITSATSSSANDDNQREHDLDVTDNSNGESKEGKEPQACPSVSSGRIILDTQIKEIMIDTTPKKSMVSQILGGPFTFLGQYESEGIILMVRRQPMGACNNDKQQENEAPRVIDGLVLNPHQLQPPFHDTSVYGDVLLMRVAPNPEDEDEQNENDEIKKSEVDDDTKDSIVDEKQKQPIELLSNEEFFQNYTKDEYIKFASRTDIVPLPPSSTNDEEGDEVGNDENIEGEEGEKEDNDENDDDNDEEEDDEEFVLGGSDEEDYFDEDDEEAQIGMMNLLLAQIIKKFREENQRGPTTEELLAIKSEVGKQLGIDESILGGDTGTTTIESTPTIDKDDASNGEDGKNEQVHNDDDDNKLATSSTSTSEEASKKRKSDKATSLSTNNKAKKVKFTKENQFQIKLIPGIEKKDIVYEEEEVELANIDPDDGNEEEEKIVLGIDRKTNSDGDLLLEEGEEEI